jgi:hypothetical protein
VAGDPVNATDPSGEQTAVAGVEVTGFKCPAFMDCYSAEDFWRLFELIGGLSRAAVSAPATAFAAVAIYPTKANGDEDKILEQKAEDRRRKSRPTNAPAGTKPIDKGLKDRGKIHDIKKGIGAAPDDWVGVTPEGEIITTDPETGEAVDQGHVDDF